MQHYLTPVIHVRNLDQTLRNIEVCQQAATKGFFLINHGIPCRQLARIAAEVRQRFPAAWMGVNVLDEHPLRALPQFIPMDAYWTDDPCLVEGREEQGVTQGIRSCLQQHHSKALFFGSVAFKYQPQPRNLTAMTKLPAQHVDVITTSGDGTGIATDLQKISTMAQASRSMVPLRKELAIASGITPQNAAEYLPYVQWYLVATGISSDFHTLDPSLTKQLQELLSNDEKSRNVKK